ncbi:MAG TPA: RecX family transcriptional regulator [Candidatus Kapabacteria bacterium]|nr:RecX family transcriptional regulator [Candidatus Kapabacteria bacterium]
MNSEQQHTPPKGEQRAPEASGDPELVITGVQTQVGNELRRSIYVNDTFAFGVSEEIYVRYSLFRGRKVTEEFIEEVRAADEVFRCREKAMRYHALRMHSRREMERKLLEKEFSPEAVAATLTFLEEYGMVNDAAFAAGYVHDRLLKKTVGTGRLRDELRRRGIAEEHIDAALNASHEEDDQSRALAAARRKAPTIRQSDPRKWERAMTNFLAGRGFNWETIRSALATLRSERAGTEHRSDDEPADEEPFMNEEE